MVLYLYKLEYSSQICIARSLVEIGPVVLEKKVFIRRESWYFIRPFLGHTYYILILSDLCQGLMRRRHENFFSYYPIDATYQICLRVSQYFLVLEHDNNRLTEWPRWPKYGSVFSIENWDSFKFRISDIYQTFVGVLFFMHKKINSLFFFKTLEEYPKEVSIPIFTHQSR